MESPTPPLPDPYQPITEAPPEVREVIKRVLDLEKAWFHSERPRVRQDIVDIVKEAVK